jgi:hypothetical protein
MVEPVKRLVDAGVGTWVPIVLHMAWEADQGFEGLQRLVETVAPYAAPWEDFLGAVDRSASM